MTYFDTCASPLGPITLATDGANLTALHLEGDRYFTELPFGWTRDSSQPILMQAEAELSEYFAGTRTTFSVPVASSGTPFQHQVWAALADVPAGRTTTYADIARAIDRPAAVRAVGTAIGRNPICIIVPCHRVLASNGGLGGYVAGLERKQQLLELEAQA
jgi:methylated-DNA-[protein]-cysteine S-methyltransferase